MMYYSGRYFYNDPPRKPKVEIEAKPIEYASKDEVQELKKNFEVVDNYIRFFFDKEGEHKNDLDQMYQTIDMLKYDAQQVKQLVNYLCDRVESAPNVAKRKRKVTICANGQTVEVCRHN